MNDHAFERLLKESLIEAAEQDYVEKPVKDFKGLAEPSDGFKNNMAQLLRASRQIQRPGSLNGHSLWNH